MYISGGNIVIYYDILYTFYKTYSLLYILSIFLCFTVKIRINEICKLKILFHNPCTSKYKNSKNKNNVKLWGMDKS